MPKGIMDIPEIAKKLPHRYPFQLVDRIVEVEPHKRILGYKNITMNEPHFGGHFPGNPIMPGVLQIEAMAQVGGLLLHLSYDLEDGQLLLFRGVDECKFRRLVIPGDRLMMELTMMSFHRGICKMRAEGSVDGKVVTTAVLSTFLELPEGSKVIRPQKMKDRFK